MGRRAPISVVMGIRGKLQCMAFYDFTWKVATYRPVELGDVEFEILNYFVENGSSFSTYQVFKMFKQASEIENQFLNLSNGESVLDMYMQLHEKFKEDKCFVLIMIRPLLLLNLSTSS